jgi:hypothetical protein
MNQSETVVDLIQAVLYSNSSHRYVSSISSRVPLRVFHRAHEADENKFNFVPPLLHNVKDFYYTRDLGLLVTVITLRSTQEPLRTDEKYGKKLMLLSD